MTDSRTVRLVVLLAGLTLLATVGGGIALAALDKALPDALIALGAGALGLLSGLAVPTGNAGPVEVRVADEPVRVVEEHGDPGYSALEVVLVVLVVLACLAIVVRVL